MWRCYFILIKKFLFPCSISFFLLFIVSFISLPSFLSTYHFSFFSSLPFIFNPSFFLFSLFRPFPSLSAFFSLLLFLTSVVSLSLSIYLPLPLSFCLPSLLTFRFLFSPIPYKVYFRRRQCWISRDFKAGLAHLFVPHYEKRLACNGKTFPQEPL